MKKYIPKLVKLSDEAISTLPKALADALPAGHMAYAVQPEGDGAVCISDAPDTIGHVCAFVKAEHVEFLPKTTAKSPKVSIDVCIEPQNDDDISNRIIMVAVPDNMTDEEMLAAVAAAGPNLGSYKAKMHVAEGEPAPEIHEVLAAYLTEYGPGEATVLKPDLELHIEL